MITSYSALDIREAPLAKPHELFASGFKDALSCITFADAILSTQPVQDLFRDLSSTFPTRPDSMVDMQYIAGRCLSIRIVPR